MNSQGSDQRKTQCKRKGKTSPGIHRTFTYIAVPTRLKFFLPLPTFNVSLSALTATLDNSRYLAVESSRIRTPRSGWQTAQSISAHRRCHGLLRCHDCSVSTFLRVLPKGIVNIHSRSSGTMTHSLEEFLNLFHAPSGDFAHAEVDVCQGDETGSSIDESCLWAEICRIV